MIKQRRSAFEKAWLHLVILFLLFSLSACDAPYGPAEFVDRGCTGCHRVEIDPFHDFGCTECHLGNPSSTSTESAHNGLVAHPASPENMGRFCGRCHAGAVKHASASDHFTLRDEIGYVWRSFIPPSALGDQEDIPLPGSLKREEYPWSLQGLVADMLRKRCLRCHVWYEGDGYEGTRRGTGCSACHLSIVATPGDHVFRKEVDDHRCLSCHYGNFVGWDYYGRFEKDYPADFRAPLHKGHHVQRSYGVEWLDMNPDVHFRKGMKCISCHGKGPCSKVNLNEALSCTSCHSLEILSQRPGHTEKTARKVSCTVCHAVWAPVDIGRSLMRLDAPDYDEWLRLSVQNSFEVEELCRTQSRLEFDAWSPAAMKDKIDHVVMPGMWFEGFVARRFYPVMVGVSTDGRLVNVRPLLDLSISYLNADDMIMADNLKPDSARPEVSGISRILRDFNPYPDFITYLEPGLYEKPGLWLEFTPHTVGQADVFRTILVNRWLADN